jgi:CRP-like cAMP-binding protein
VNQEAPVSTREEIADVLAGFALFGDLHTAQLLGVAGTLDEVFFPEGERVLRQGLSATGFFVILEGSADVTIDGTKRATLHRGDFFGEVSIILGEPPTADIVAVTPMRCLTMTGSAVEPFLLANPRVMYRMLQAQARRLRNANRWRS